MYLRTIIKLAILGYIAFQVFAGANALLRISAALASRHVGL